MPKEIKELLGAMDLDSPIETIGKGFCQEVRNIEWRGLPPNRRAEIKSGNSLIQTLLLPVGNNKTINAKYDLVKKRIYYFNWNSNGNHGIYVFNTIPRTFQRLVEVGVNTSGDVLAFTAESLYNIDIIYGDSLQGDILCFTDSLGRPSKINVDRALSNGYGTIQRSFLDIAKEPPDIPPYVVYENDAANTINNLRKKLFRIKERWVFDDHDKSVTSSQSEMAIPFNAFDQATDTDPTKNCRLAITYQTGPSNVKKVELLASVAVGNVMSDFFLIASIDKNVSGIPDNDIATYLFYNDKAYNYIDVLESDQLFDYVPLKAVAQCIPNGNVIDYGNITEGYPNLTDFGDGINTSNITTGQRPWYWGNNYAQLIANENGKSLLGATNIHITLRGIINTPSFQLDTYSVYFSDNSNIGYTANIGDDAAAIINGLRSNAIANGFTIISVSSNDLIIFKSGVYLFRTFINSNYSFNGLLNTSYNAFDWSSNQAWGLVYYDEKGRTNGAVYTNGFSVQQSVYTEGTFPNDKPYLLASIYHLPPDWAFSFQWVRTKNLSKQKLIQWISDRTFKDTTATNGIIKYAYLSIESLNTFVQNNPGSPLAYTFTAGDRVRFFKRYNADGSTAYLYYNTKDFEVVATLINPTINGDTKIGQFIKIILPSTDGSFDFGTGFDNYFIEIYTPAQSVANNLNFYYEYGERYAIGYPGTGARFHQGMLQNQIFGSQAATYEWTKGDYYIRLRAIQTGNVYKWNAIQGSLSNTNYFLVGLNFAGSTYASAGITGNSVPIVPLSNSFNPSGDSRSFLNVTPNTTFKVGGSLTLNFPTDYNGDSWSLYIYNIYTDVYTLVQSIDTSKAGTYTFDITSIHYLGNTSSSITLENDRIFLIAKSDLRTTLNSGLGARNVNILSGNPTFTIDHIINQWCIDPNFSDYYPSAVNSNGRALVYDENANQVTFPVLHRWSLAYQSDTNINQANRFYAENFDSLDRGNGALMRTAVWERMLTFFQERKIGQTGIYQKYITNSGGDNQLITTDNIITPNNVSYYSGQFGVGNQPTSVVQSGFVFYGVDSNKYVVWRLSRDGLIDLTEKYRVKTWAGNNLPKYLNPGTYINGGQQKVLGAFNIRPDNVGEYLLLAQGTELISGETLVFEEDYNFFSSFHDIDCDYMVCAENTWYMFKAGQLYKIDTGSQVSNYFGIQYIPSIKLVYNESSAIKKVFNSLAFQSDSLQWSLLNRGDVQTNKINNQTGLKQESLVMAADFNSLEKPYLYASFNRDQNSMLDPDIALWEGDYLCGSIIVCKYSYSGNTNSYFYSPYIIWQPHNRNF
jgi:hypothetical protein